MNKCVSPLSAALIRKDRLQALPSEYRSFFLPNSVSTILFPEQSGGDHLRIILMSLGIRERLALAGGTGQKDEGAPASSL